MLRISQLKLPLHHADADLAKAAARRLGIPPAAIQRCAVYRRAIDARGRAGVSLSYTLDVEIAREAEWLAKRGAIPGVDPAPGGGYAPPSAPASADPGGRPVVIGSGPCGIFCAYVLAMAGLRPVVLERGKAAGDRARDVTGFWRRGLAFDPESNVQFGEGGAGTFSDGKLYTQVSDKDGRLRWILETLAAHGAPDDILVKARPHIGTDRLIKVVRNLRAAIEQAGGEYRFGARAEALRLAGGRVAGVELAGGEFLAADRVVLAVGHSARDTFASLWRSGVPFEPKPFSMGVRIEHPQGLIDRCQYGKFAGDPALGAAPYKFVYHARNGRSAYSFCMCPGGLVVAAASEGGGVVTNGMSSYARAEANANSGFMADVRPEDYGGTAADPLAGIRFQRDWERRAFELGGSNYRAPAQLLGDFLAGRPSTGPGKVNPSYQPGVTWTDLRRCLPDFVADTLREAIPHIARKLRGFDLPDAVLTAPETRSSSPIRIPRDPESLQCQGIEGLFPAGEGAGYAGGIISAAADGTRAAEAVLRTNPER